jgi:hypothetical protein
VSSFYKENLEARFYNDVLEATKLVAPSIEEIEFKVDRNIDNPSNADVIDCANFYKEDTKSKKVTKNTEGSLNVS